MEGMETPQKSIHFRLHFGRVSPITAWCFAKDKAELQTAARLFKAGTRKQAR